MAAQLALALAARGAEVGLLDVDICGPSAPRLLGVSGADVHQSGAGWSPVPVPCVDGLTVMSVGFLLPDPDAAVVWRGPRKNALIKQFLKDVDWGALDYLVVDTPPGTSDEHISLAQLLPLAAGADGAILVTTPQEVALADVRKEASFCAKVGLPLLGVVENMACLAAGAATAAFLGADGGDATAAVAAAVDAALGAGTFASLSLRVPLFHTPAGVGGGRALAAAAGAPFLGEIPLDPGLGRACEEGVPATPARAPAAAGALEAVVAAVVAGLEQE